MGLWDFFSGGQAQLGGLQQLSQMARQQLLERQQREGPGPRELAAEQQRMRAMAQLQSQGAGLTGAQGALARRRMTTMAPVMFQTAAQQTGVARGADVEAEEAAMQALFGQALGAEEAYASAAEAERQRKAFMRQRAIGGLFDIGTRLAFPAEKPEQR